MQHCLITLVHPSLGMRLLVALLLCGKLAGQNVPKADLNVRETDPHSTAIGTSSQFQTPAGVTSGNRLPRVQPVGTNHPIGSVLSAERRIDLTDRPAQQIGTDESPAPRPLDRSRLQSKSTCRSSAFDLGGQMQNLEVTGEYAERYLHVPAGPGASGKLIKFLVPIYREKAEIRK